MHLAEVESTNLHARRLTVYPDEGIAVIAADRQWAGRGQRGNTFFSDTGGGIWASIVVPLDNLSSHFVFNRAVSLAIFDALVGASPGLRAGIKWPNDIYVNDRKICGILLETIQHERQYLVVGFGVNVNVRLQDLPPSLRMIATSLHIETGATFSIPALLHAIAAGFERYRHMAAPQAHATYVQRLYRLGWRVRLGDREGIFQSVGDDGRACIVGQTEMKHISSGPLHFIGPGSGESPVEKGGLGVRDEPQREPGNDNEQPATT